MSRSARPYLVLAIGFFTVGTTYLAMNVKQFRFDLGIFILFLPASLWLGTHFLAQRKSLWHIATFFLAILGSFGLGLLILITPALREFSEQTAPVTDPARYNEILTGRWEDEKDLVSHFPRWIPKDATQVRFSFEQGFLQGGSHLQLRCHLPAERIAELHDQFAKFTTKSFFGAPSHTDLNSVYMPSTYFHTADQPHPDANFPDDFEVMIFDPVPQDNNVDWNHAHSHGVAISKQRNEIVYWAESW